MNTKRLLFIILSSILPVTAFAQSSPGPSASASASAAKTIAAPAVAAPDGAELTKLLRDFLAGAGRNDIAMHDRFWADELVYTSALGRRKGKADIMRELRAETAATPKPEEGIRIQQYGDTAIVAFRLVATTDKAGTKTVANYFNTGTFLKRNAKWQVIAWQATALPKPDTK